MKYIRSCDNCLKEVRFPLDRGTLLVKCPYCGFTFRIDPDDPSTFKTGRFDLPSPTQSFETIVTNENSFWSNIKQGFRNSISQNQNEGIKRVVVGFLFFLLFINVFKMCSFTVPTNIPNREEKIELDEEEKLPSPETIEKPPYET